MSATKMKSIGWKLRNSWSERQHLELLLFNNNNRTLTTHRTNTIQELLPLIKMRLKNSRLTFQIKIRRCESSMELLLACNRNSKRRSMTLPVNRMNGFNTRSCSTRLSTSWSHLTRTHHQKINLRWTLRIANTKFLLHLKGRKHRLHNRSKWKR